MLESDIQTLADREPDRLRDTLKAEVWRGVEANARMSPNDLSWPAAAVAFVLVTVIVTGNFAVHAEMTDSSWLGIFSPKTDLAPSTILLGGKI
ncbi:MAG: hypothetical protein K2P94_14485 [Rhodospirillaceae bacterium]|nr:hypothetical protein [Rhodospirillaceae bacterium]